MQISPVSTQETTVGWPTTVPGAYGFYFGDVYQTNGIAIIDFTSVTPNPTDWTWADVVFSLQPPVGNFKTQKGFLVSCTASATPSSFDVVSNLDPKQTIGWAVNYATAVWDQPSNKVNVTIGLAVKTKYSEVLRVAYQVTTFARTK